MRGIKNVIGNQSEASEVDLICPLIVWTNLTGFGFKWSSGVFVQVVEHQGHIDASKPTMLHFPNLQK